MHATRVTVQKIGGELVLLFPDDFVETNGLREGDTFTVEESGAGILLVPQAGGEWELWRQDDNGNRASMGVFPTRAAAEGKQAEFESRHHKQIYWVEPRPGTPPPA